MGEPSPFFAVAARAMRQILIDHARAKSTAKRGHGLERITRNGLIDSGASELDVVALNEILEELAALHERQYRIVELRFFGGMTTQEIAHVLHA